MEILKKELIQIPTVMKWTRREKIKVNGCTSWDYFIVYQNCLTGCLGHKIHEVVNTNLPYLVIEKKSKTISGYTIQYDEDINMLAIIKATFNSRAIKEGECRFWEEQDRYYVDKDKNIYIKSFGNEYEINHHKTLSSMPFDCTKFIDIRLDHKTNESESINEIYKLFPKCVSMSGNRLYSITNFYWFFYFLQYKEPVKRNGPKQKRIDELISIKLPKFDWKKYDNIDDFTDFNGTAKISVIQKVPTDKENICVLRTFKVLNQTEEIYEGGRYYIGQNECIACKIDNKGNYIQAALHNDAGNWRFKLLEIEENAAVGTKLEYCLSIIDDFNEELKSIAVMTFMQWPVFEMIYKLGYKKYIKTIINYHKYDSPIKGLEKDFGKLGTGKNLNKILGLNKYQLKIALDNAERYVDNYGGYYSSIVIIKKIVGMIPHREYWQVEREEHKAKYVSLADIDNETFDKLFAFVKNIMPSSHGGKGHLYNNGSNVPIINCAVYTNKLYGMKTTINTLNNILFAASSKTGPGWRNTTYIIFLRDFLDMVKEMNMSNRFKPYFDSLEELKEMHDEIALLYNSFKEKIEIEKWEKRKPFWNKFVYDDSNYKVITPENPEDLAAEGLKLHHCVKGYIKKVTNGETNIVFIRKAEEENIPFFTVEISNNNCIQQIHGSCNRNLDTEPDLIYFVNDWIENCNLKESNYNKIR